MRQVENGADLEGYFGLEGHGRAASMPRLDSQYYVSPLTSLLYPCTLSHRTPPEPRQGCQCGACSNQTALTLQLGQCQH